MNFTGDPSPLPPPPANLEQALQHAINCWSAENGSDTPDFILSQYLMGCLNAWNEGVRQREKWYGREKWKVEPPMTPVSP